MVELVELVGGVEGEGEPVNAGEPVTADDDDNAADLVANAVAAGDLATLLSF